MFVIAGASGATVSFSTSSFAVATLPSLSVNVAVTSNVPSFRLLTSTFGTSKLPSAFTVTSFRTISSVVSSPSLITKSTVAASVSPMLPLMSAFSVALMTSLLLPSASLLSVMLTVGCVISPSSLPSSP